MEKNLYLSHDKGMWVNYTGEDSLVSHLTRDDGDVGGL